jgi:hypothetical protein
MTRSQSKTQRAKDKKTTKIQRHLTPSITRRKSISQFALPLQAQNKILYNSRKETDERKSRQMMFFKPVEHIRRGEVGTSSAMTIKQEDRIQTIRSQRTPVQKIPYTRDAIVMTASRETYNL